jgi:deoxyhypusine monooxygenase
MFSLRNRGGAQCVQALAAALSADRSSALLRHELAFVLGQTQVSGRRRRTVVGGG